MAAPTSDRQASAQLFQSLPGGSEIVEWFGFLPSFHDATLTELTLASGSATLRLMAFRMTSQTDPSGHFVLDKQALVTFQFSGVSGVSLAGDASSIIFELTLHRVDEPPGGYRTCGGPRAGDYEVRLESSYGLAGSVFAREVHLTLTPAQPR